MVRVEMEIWSSSIEVYEIMHVASVCLPYNASSRMISAYGQ